MPALSAGGWFRRLLAQCPIRLHRKSSPARCDDPSTWRHNRQHIDRSALEILLEVNGGSQGLDLHGADLSNVDLKQANLSGAHLEHANLSGTQLQRAHLRGTYLQEANLRKAQLQGVDLYHVESLAGVSWYGAFLDRTRMRQKHLGKKAIRDEADAHRKKTACAYHEASEAYLLLKNNFTSIGRYEGSAWAYVKEQQMEKMEHYWKWRADGGQIWRVRGSLWRCLCKWGYELLTGYGERPLRPLVWAVGLVAVFFPLLYWAIGALPGHSRAFTSSSPSDIDWAGWGDSLIFSLTSFGTLSFTRLQPEGTLPNLIAAFEAMIGVLLFALFVFTLGNRMSRS